MPAIKRLRDCRNFINLNKTKVISDLDKTVTSNFTVWRILF